MKYYICSSTCPRKKDSTNGQVCIISHRQPNLTTTAVRYGLVGKTNGRGTTIVFLFEGCRKKFTRFFYKCIFGHDFLPPCTTIFSGIETIPALAYLVALMIQHSCYHAQTFEVCGPKLFQSENKFFPLLQKQCKQLKNQLMGQSVRLNIGFCHHQSRSQALHQKLGESLVLIHM